MCYDYGMASNVLDLAGIRADVPRYRTKAAAEKAIREQHLSGEVQPERAEFRFTQGWWVLAATPVGDPGEGRVLRTDNGWTIRCAVDCHDSYRSDASRICPGHPMTAAEAREFTIVLIGHRIEVIPIGLFKENGSFSNGLTDWVGDGFVYKARCVSCRWASPTFTHRPHAARAGKGHTTQV